MESYQLSFNATPTGGKKNLPASGDLFVYESASVAAGGETRIKVKPANGNTIILKPGQWFRYPDPVTDWAMESFNGNDVIDAVFVIGFGEFGDANTLNKFTLDATLANNVTVTNSTAQRIPVALDPLAVLNTNQNIMQFSASFESSAGSANALKVLDASANVNGVDVKQLLMVGSIVGSDVVCLIAKATAPANSIDGDLLDALVIPNTSSVVKSQTNIRVPAGKGVWLLSGNDTGTTLKKSVLYSVL